MIRKHKLLIFLTTNYKEKLDSALKRSGRIDY
jgi:ATP-dependent 26S proteasome regulatory subunit